MSRKKELSRKRLDAVLNQAKHYSDSICAPINIDDIHKITEKHSKRTNKLINEMEIKNSSTLTNNTVNVDDSIDTNITSNKTDINNISKEVNSYDNEAINNTSFSPSTDSDVENVSSDFVTAENDTFIEDEEPEKKIQKIDFEKISREKQRKKQLMQSTSYEEKLYVSIDAKGAQCAIYNKDGIVVQKLVRGYDKTQVGLVANYSHKVMKRRLSEIVDFYKLSKEQASRIDTFIYATLLEYDDSVWTNKCILSNRAEEYIKCITKDFKKYDYENKNEYLVRCQTLRKKALAESNLRIEYNTYGLWSSLNLKFIDKIMINKFSNIFDIAKNKKYFRKLLERNNLQLLQEKN